MLCRDVVCVCVCVWQRRVGWALGGDGRFFLGRRACASAPCLIEIHNRKFAQPKLGRLSSRTIGRSAHGRSVGLRARAPSPLHALVCNTTVIMATTMEDATPRAFLCPISHELMHDPVCVADGHTYEREHIERWLTTSLTSPATGQALAHTALVRNHALRQATEEHLQICVRRGEDWAVDLLNRARQPLGERDDVRKLEEEMNAAAKGEESHKGDEETPG